LPGLRLVFIVVFNVIVVTIKVVVEVVVRVEVLIVAVVILVEVKTCATNHMGHRLYEVGSAAGAAFAAGGGYVDQKCLPHFGHTQNWSGRHGMPGAGSRISISAPQR
jgi:hypothetical protein